MSLLLPLLLSNFSAPAMAQEEPKLEFDLEGYYRIRWHHFNGLFDPHGVPPTATNPDPQSRWTNEPGTGRYTNMRLRLQPSFSYSDAAKLVFMVDMLDGALYGDNESLASTSLFAGNPTATGLLGTPTDMFALRRAWMEFKIPVGVIRVGRQASNWGLGLLANDGNGFKNTFGESYGGATFDRFVFATKPIAVFQGLTGRDGPDIPLFLILGMDRLVEDPLIQYYGYRCDSEDESDDIANGGLCEPGEDHSYTEDRDAQFRPDNWWTEHDDDVIQFIYATLYKGEDLTLLGKGTDLSLGFYSVNRVQRETNSNIWILDFYSKLQWGNLYHEGESVMIAGCSEAIALPGTIGGDAEGGDCDDDDGLESPLAKQPFIRSTVQRLGYKSQPFGGYLEAGFASGDDNVVDPAFTGRAINPDYNVGLLVYEQMLERVTRYIWTDSVNGLWSNGGVYNSYYLYPNVRYTPLKNWDLHAAFLVVFPHKPDGAFILTDDQSDSSIIGWEADLALKTTWHDHVLFSLEGAYGRVTDRIPYANLNLAGAGRSSVDDDLTGSLWTVQSRLAYEF